MIEIRALPQRDGVDVARVLEAVTGAVAALLGEEPRQTWATWEQIQPRCYAEGAETAARQPRSTHPPLVRVAAFEGRSAAVIGGILQTIAAALVRELDLDEGNVFVRYEEQTAGRLFTGGLVR